MIDPPNKEAMERDDTSSEGTLVDTDLATHKDDGGDVEMSGQDCPGPASPAAELSVPVPVVQALEEDKVPAVHATTISEIDTERPPPIPPRKKPDAIKMASTPTDKRKEKLEFGAQQDVTEVIGNVMFRLQCAIKPTSIDDKFGEQIDQIRETFYGSNAVYLKKADTYHVKVEDWASIIVFPGPDGMRDIYQALDVVFDEQEVEIDNALTPQYTSIKKLPPILQIQIQRTAYDPVKQQAGKNNNWVSYPETIYLDRYLDSAEDSPLMQRRKNAWEWKALLRSLEVRQTILQNSVDRLPIANALLSTKEYITMLQEDDELADISFDIALPDALESRATQLLVELDSITADIASLKAKLDDQFTDLRQAKYRLQAIFIHRGHGSFGGHYWVYIYDFVRDIWREYNDDRVMEVTDLKRVFGIDAVPGATPYYLVYVKDEEKDDLVDAVYRDILEVDEVSEVQVADNSGQGKLPDVIELSDEEGVSSHVEHRSEQQQATMRPKWDETTTTNDGAWEF